MSLYPLDSPLEATLIYYYVADAYLADIKNWQLYTR